MSAPRKKISKIRAEEHKINAETLVIISSFEQLLATMHGFEALNEYKIEKTRANWICLSSDQISMELLSSAIWKNGEELRPHLTKKLILVGTSADFDSLPEILSNINYGTIHLPLTSFQLNIQIRNFIKMHRMLEKSERFEENVQNANETFQYVLKVARELNGVRDTNLLLSLILQKAREICNADAGSIFLVQWKDNASREGTVKFVLAQNDSMQQSLEQFSIPISDKSIIGKAVIEEASISIPDLYRLDPNPKNNPFGAQYDISWDKKTGYECHSMLTLPMYAISNRVNGVIQLINRKRPGVTKLQEAADFRTQVLPFDAATIENAEIISHQAGIALENALLTEEREKLFDGFVHASVSAIEQRDPTTSGHSTRVATLSTSTAKLIDTLAVGPFANVSFTTDQIKELEYASLLHDFGKIGVRERVLTKAKKLYPWELDWVLERFQSALSSAEIENLREMVKYHEFPGSYPPGFDASSFSTKFGKKFEEVEKYLEFVLKCNEPTVLEQGGFELLKTIANTTFKSAATSRPRFLLEEGELEALSISRGSLTSEEFSEIQSHVSRTYEFLRKIPWGSNFKNLPQIAAKHHEKLDGSGYPSCASGEEIPIQTRIMTISDIYDALTASDRPYKKAVPVEKALDILMMEVKSGKCDPEIFKIFCESGIYKTVL